MFKIAACKRIRLTLNVYKTPPGVGCEHSRRFVKVITGKENEPGRIFYCRRVALQMVQSCPALQPEAPWRPCVIIGECAAEILRAEHRF
jgi:hypothetical protein